MRRGDGKCGFPFGAARIELCVDAKRLHEIGYVMGDGCFELRFELMGFSIDPPAATDIFALKINRGCTS